LLGAIPILGAASHPGLVPSLVLFTLMGACTACLIPAQAAVMTALPDELRGRVFGIAATGLAAAQLLATVSAGAAAEIFPPTTVVAGTGLLGIVAVGALLAADATRRTATAAQRTGEVPMPPQTVQVMETDHPSSPRARTKMKAGK
jgi:MFS family permease